MNYNFKSLIQSKVFWLAILQSVIGAYAVFASSYPEIATIGWIAMAKSVLDIILRTQTTATITRIV